MIRFTHEMEKAKRIVVDIKGNTQEYALSFLHIWNNAREYSNVFYKVENCYDSRVYVTCSVDEVDSVKEYLADFGEILAVDDINKVNVILEYDNTKDFEKLYPDDCDTEFFLDVE